jgi:RNA polymerase sigma factor (sigma-70 family)
MTSQTAARHEPVASPAASAGGPKRRAPSFPWEQTMAASLEGDAAAYRLLLTEATRWLNRYFARRLQPSMIPDAVQEALMALHTKRATFTPGRPFLPWLAAIARFKGVDCLRAAHRTRSEELNESELSVDSHENAALSNIAISGLFDRIRGPQAEAIRLVKLQGFSVRDAAAMTGQSEALIKVNIHRGLAALRALFGNSEELGELAF